MPTDPTPAEAAVRVLRAAWEQSARGELTSRAFLNMLDDADLAACVVRGKGVYWSLTPAGRALLGDDA